MKIFKIKPKKWESNNSQWNDNWEFIVRASNENIARSLVKNTTSSYKWAANSDTKSAWDNTQWLDEEATVCQLWNDERFSVNGKEEILWPEDNQWKNWGLWTKWG